MKKILTIICGATITSLAFSLAIASPQQDQKNFRNYFAKKIPDTKFPDYQNGIYSIDAASRGQWESIEEFPPYEPFVETGEAAWNKKFKNGKTYASCFSGTATKNIRVKFPHWDDKKSRVQTLESALQECAKANGSRLNGKKGKLAHISAYLAFEARGQKINVKIPNAKAHKAYEDGKRFFYAKRGQLNLACADCHVYNSGMNVRADKLSPALGHVTHFPVFRAKWTNNPKGDGFGTLHRRYGGCNSNIRAKPFKAQSNEYRNLEYFQAYMSNGLGINGPGYRK